MNDWKNKRCNMCSRVGHSLRHHDYTLLTGAKPIQVPHCEFFACDFCGVQTPTAITVQKLGEARESSEYR